VRAVRQSLRKALFVDMGWKYPIKYGDGWIGVHPNGGSMPFLARKKEKDILRGYVKCLNTVPGLILEGLSNGEDLKNAVRDELIEIHSFKAMDYHE
jgi:hypothetical protein